MSEFKAGDWVRTADGVSEFKAGDWVRTADGSKGMVVWASPGICEVHLDGDPGGVVAVLGTDEIVPVDPLPVGAADHTL